MSKRTSAAKARSRSPSSSRSAREIAARVAACKAKAQALMADLDGLIGELPEWREGVDEKSLESALMEVRAELEMAVGQVDGAIDYLTPRNDDEAPDCCAHRQLQALIDGAEATA